MKKRIVLLFSLIGLLLVTIVSTSFALFTKSKAQDGINQITTYNCLDISIEGENELNLTNAYPIKDEEGVLQAPYLFTIKNNCDHYVGVDLGVEYQEESTISPSEVKATLNKPSEGIMPQILSNYNLVQATDGETGLPTENAKYIMVHEGLPAGDSQTFEYRMWLDYSVENLSTSDKLKVKIVAIGTVKTEEEAPKNWYSSEGNTLLAVLRNNNSVRKPLTKPGNAINLESESVLASAQDDYGTSYYYRGNVKNNYVTFADKCWRIVRIDGNGNIKLWLWNNNGTDCTTNAARSSAFNAGSVKYNKDAGGTGNLYQTASSVGFMYGKPDSTEVFTDNNTGAQDNITDSTILTALKTWYDNTFDTANTTDYTDLLADVIWCGDKSFYSGPGYAQSTDTNKVDTYFNAYKRLTQNPKSPSLVCPDNSFSISGVTYNVGKVSKYTAQDTINGNGMLKTAIAGTDPTEYKYYKIGLITADEAVYAGGVYAVANSYYYLYTGSHYWTMSPSYFYGSNAYVWYVSSMSVLGLNIVSGGYGLRPAIALDKSVTISSGNGTINNPYVISV